MRAPGTVQVTTSSSEIGVGWGGVGLKRRKRERKHRLRCERRSSLLSLVWRQVDRSLGSLGGRFHSCFCSTRITFKSDLIMWRIFLLPSEEDSLVKGSLNPTQQDPERQADRQGGGEQTVITYASVFGLRLLLPQNKYVLKGRPFTDITAHPASAGRF